MITLIVAALLIKGLNASCNCQADIRAENSPLQHRDLDGLREVGITK